MPPTILLSGNAHMNQPYVFGQSGTDSPEPVLVTSPPAKIRTAVDAATSAAKSGSMGNDSAGADPRYALNVKATSLVSFSPMVTVCVCVPSFSCHASMV